MPISRSFFAIRHALRTCVTKFLRSSSLPIAEPPFVGPHTGATTDPTARFFAPILSASALIWSSVESIETCGSNRKRSTPSNFWPSTSAFAVYSSIVSRSIAGSAPGLPLPTRPGHMALWSLGKLFLGGVISGEAFIYSTPIGNPAGIRHSFECRKKYRKGVRGKGFFGRNDRGNEADARTANFLAGLR